MNNRNFRSAALASILFLLTFFVAGCWDRKEIENRGLVLGIAIDYTSPETKGKYDLPHVSQEAGERKYRVSYELPRFRKPEGEKGAGGAEQHIVFSGEGESIFAVSRAMSAKTYFNLFFEDLQILLFSEDVARDGIADLLDFFVRNPGIRRRVKLFVTPGKAEDILRGKLLVEEINSIFIAKTTRNVNQVPRFASKQDLGDVSEAIRNKRAFFMPYIVMEQGDIKLTSAALFNKDAKYVGHLDELEVVGAKIIRTVLKGGVYTVANPANPAKLVAFELLEPRIMINSHVEGERLWFTLEAKFIGNLGENTELGQDALDEKFLAAVEQELAAEFTRQAEAAYYKTQVLKVDILDLGLLVHRQHPKYWKQIEKKWDDEIFPTVPLETNIRVIVRRPGMAR